MRLRYFAVRGYKNLTQLVALNDLERVNVLHGANNIGKSNLLQAMDLYFRLLDLERDGWLPIAVDRSLSHEQLLQLGFPPGEIFNLESPAPISLSAVIETDAAELTRSGIKPLLDATSVDVEVVLTWNGDSTAYRVVRFRFADGVDASAVQASPEKRSWVLRFAKFLTANFLVRTHKAARFARISTDRISSQTLALALYDAKESADLELARRWQRFVAATSMFQDILGEGAFIVTYDRHVEKAGLYYQTRTARIPLHLLGSGVQQIVAVLGSLLVTNASLVALEEPEQNLRYPLQERLRDVLTQHIVGSEGGPSQLFMASHSPAFEPGDKFYLMTAGETGPRIEVHTVADSLTALGFPTHANIPGTPESAARCYVSIDGVVRIPEEIREVLGLPQGGGVMFIPRDQHVEIYSDERFLDMLGEPSEAPGAEHDDDAR